MDRIIEISHQLLLESQNLLDTAQAGELSTLEAIQQRRADLFAELDIESRRNHPKDLLVRCRDLIKNARGLEQEAISLLLKQRDAVKSEHDKLQLGKRALKAYDRFR